MEFGRSWVDILREAKPVPAARNSDPWLAPLSRLKGTIDFADGLERISSQKILDLLEVPNRTGEHPFIGELQN